MVQEPFEGKPSIGFALVPDPQPADQGPRIDSRLREKERPTRIDVWPQERMGVVNVERLAKAQLDLVLANVAKNEPPSRGRLARRYDRHRDRQIRVATLDRIDDHVAVFVVRVFEAREEIVHTAERNTRRRRRICVQPSSAA
jgi:hypothetical protein